MKKLLRLNPFYVDPGNNLSKEAAFERTTDEQFETVI